MIGDAEPTGVTHAYSRAPVPTDGNDLATKIRSGDLKPGDKLPSTRELAESHEVHMNTASRALSLLHDRELITGQPGRGTYVAERPID
ncbi:winged helix-turn-helix domain-containing protein [Micromonospora sp. KC213]|uniref:GntR family transcriptional regulator n=1 Tax=Micromonospora sp. KC213 TaxID=2530378 RepID=UPI001FB61C02|nr:winged helix-turn-helix domain-containing protein [Micromonospora sp. KC213]